MKSPVMFPSSDSSHPQNGPHTTNRMEIITIYCSHLIGHVYGWRKISVHISLALLRLVHVISLCSTCLCGRLDKWEGKKNILKVAWDPFRYFLNGLFFPKAARWSTAIKRLETLLGKLPEALLTNLWVGLTQHTIHGRN